MVHTWCSLDTTASVTNKTSPRMRTVLPFGRIDSLRIVTLFAVVWAVEVEEMLEKSHQEGIKRHLRTFGGQWNP